MHFVCIFLPLGSLFCVQKMPHAQLHLFMGYTFVWVFYLSLFRSPFFSIFRQASNSIELSTIHYFCIQKKKTIKRGTHLRTMSFFFQWKREATTNRKKRLILKCMEFRFDGFAVAQCDDFIEFSWLHISPRLEFFCQVAALFSLILLSCLSFYPSVFSSFMLEYIKPYGIVISKFRELIKCFDIWWSILYILAVNWTKKNFVRHFRENFKLNTDKMSC